MRLFVAIELNEEIKSYLCSIEKKIGNKDAKISWVAKKNLHLTLKFLGEIEGEKTDIIKERLRSIKLKKFKLSLDKIGVFPNESVMRILFVGIKAGNEIKELQKKVDEETIDLSNEPMEFIGHLTLGRVKSIKNKIAFAKKIKGIEIEKLEFDVTEFKLFKSVLSKDGPKYWPLEEYTLEP